MLARREIVVNYIVLGFFSIVSVVPILGVLLTALTPRGLEGFDEIFKLPLGPKRPFGHGD